jgi:hypothetical protein
MPHCDKPPYPTPGSATRVLKFLQKHGYEALVGIHPCVRCSAWHVTSHETSGTKWWESGKAEASQLHRSAIAPRRGPD